MKNSSNLLIVPKVCHCLFTCIYLYLLVPKEFSITYTVCYTIYTWTSTRPHTHAHTHTHTRTHTHTQDLVIESLYIPGAGVQYLMPGFSVVARTMEGDRDPLRHKQLALKKVPRSQAKKVVADVVVARGKDSISKMFTKLE